MAKSLTMRAMREAASRDQGGRCFYCRRVMTRSDSGLPTAITAEHLVPQILGGRNLNNVVAACYACNQAKGSRIEEPKRVSKKHPKRVRIDEAALERQKRKRRERVAMWSQSCLAK
jgi:5-methylcytosine-specific restriction endonuclease McrA